MAQVTFTESFESRLWRTISKGDIVARVLFVVLERRMISGPRVFVLCFAARPTDVFRPHQTRARRKRATVDIFATVFTSISFAYRCRIRD